LSEAPETIPGPMIRKYCRQVRRWWVCCGRRRNLNASSAGYAVTLYSGSRSRPSSTSIPRPGVSCVAPIPPLERG